MMSSLPPPEFMFVFLKRTLLDQHGYSYSRPWVDIQVRVKELVNNAVVYLSRRHLMH